MSDEATPITRVEDIERTPAGVVRRWMAELELAHKAEKDWRDEGKKLWDMYEGGKRKAYAFNILWSNTDTLAPALYNSTPQPDVRRRFRDADPLGKAVSEVIARGLTYEIDAYDFDACMASMVLDMLITGRGLVRVKYEPRFVGAPDAATEAASGPGDESAPDQAPTPQRVAERAVRCEAVQWDDFRRGPGKSWNEVPWIAFRHDFTQEMAAEKFGPEIASLMKYSEGKDSESYTDDKQTREMFRTCEVWEIWDKDQRRVLFIADSFKQGPLLMSEDPLALGDFYPLPRPCYAVPSSRSLVPIPLYKLYEEQAKELDRISERINKIVNAMKVRGAYSANLPEVKDLLQASEGQMVAVQNVSEIASIGGLDKAIWTLPLDDLQKSLAALYTARDQCKQAIYEISGISDIIRGATEADETATAQKIKNQWGSLRLQKMQREVQRMVRDLFRLQAEIIAEQYPAETLMQITNLPFPTAAVKAQAMQIIQQAEATGQPPPPEVVEAVRRPAWEEISAVMKSDKLREYRVDIETDSTVAETIDRDMTGMNEVVQAVGSVLAATASGVPGDVAKEVALAIVRRARLGNPVEDALEKFQPPPPAAPDPAGDLEAMKQQIVELVRSEGTKLVRAEDQAAEQQAGLQQYDKAITQTLQQVAQAGQMAQGGLQQFAQMQAAQQEVLAQLLTAVQQLGEGHMQIRAETQGTVEAALGGVANAIEAISENLAQVTQGLAAVIESVEKPKAVTIQRDKNGRISGASATVQ